MFSAKKINITMVTVRGFSEPLIATSAEFIIYSLEFVSAFPKQILLSDSTAKYSFLHL